VRPDFIKLKTDLKTNNTGFTLIEVMIAIAIIGILASIAIPIYIKYKEEARIEVAITEMKIIEKKIVNLVVDNGKLPEDLSDIGLDKIIDPWGRPYKYLKIFGSDDVKDGKGKKDDKCKKGKPRKDRSLHPINTDFDLYSVGRDGKSTAPLTAKISRDDIIRANNGDFMGLVSDY
jgi:general secretion pathway protein G